MDIYLKKQFYTLLIEKLGRRFFSEKELDLTTEYIRTYLTAKISKLSTAQTRLEHWRKIVPLLTRYVGFLVIL